MGTYGFVGQIGVISCWADNGWAAQLIKNADGEIIDTVAVSAFDWVGLGLVCFVLPAILSVVFCLILRKMNWIKENDLKLN